MHATGRFKLLLALAAACLLGVGLAAGRPNSASGPTEEAPPAPAAPPAAAKADAPKPGEERGRKVVVTGKVLGVDQPKVSALMRGRLTDFSIERLLRFLLLLGQDVHIAVTARRHSSRKQPTLEVHAAEGPSRAIAASRR